MLAEAEPAIGRRERIDNAHIHMLLAFVLRHDSNCIDVGAHQGSMLREMVRLAPEGHHIAYEPLPHLHERLCAEFPDADIRCAALSDKAEATTFRWVKNLPGMSGLEARAYPTEPEVEIINVQTERLDDAIPTTYAPTLMKIDVEGAEMRVLRGAERTLRSHHPLLIFEYGRGTEFTAYGTSPSEIWMYLADVGYRIFELDGRGPLSAAEFASTPTWNFVAHT